MSRDFYFAGVLFGAQTLISQTAERRHRLRMRILRILQLTDNHQFLRILKMFFIS